MNICLSLSLLTSECMSGIRRIQALLLLYCHSSTNLLSSPLRGWRDCALCMLLSLYSSSPPPPSPSPPAYRFPRPTLSSNLHELVY